MYQVPAILLSIFVIVISACSIKPQPYNYDDEQSIVKRSFNPMIDDKWIGNGISYGAYRDGESPKLNSLTSKQDILEDLRLMSKRWNLIRLYSTDQQSRNILSVIRDNNLPIRVMQGAWISGHQSREQNNRQVENLIALANEYPEIIVAVNVGNEIFVDWSWHKVDDPDTVIAYIRKVRSRINQPVTVNDDYNFWNKPHAASIANEIDFIGLHAYAFWNNKTIDVAMEWTESIYRDIQSRYPDYLIAYTETGWPTSRIYDNSYEGQLIGKANEQNQQIFFEQYMDWIEENKVISLYFEAFDEQWKGGFDGENAMDKAEKHWGVYYSNRQPKMLLQ
jgi:exo-beta-1,3-glucanase (GH17 family)